MRFLLCLALMALPAAAGNEDDVLKTVNGLFDAMATHSAEGIAAAFTDDARIAVFRAGQPLRRLGREEIVKALASSKSTLRERIWDPKVFVRGGIATVWAEYDVRVDGKFHHCGIDAFFLLKMDEGWKIFSLEYTAETEGCATAR